MAVAQSAYRSSINISNISKSVSSLGKGIKQAKSSALRTNTILLKSTRFKRESIARDNVFFQRRREAVRRKEQEDIIESSGIRGAFKRQREVIASSTKGFLGRIMDFVGTLMVGWLVNNLPLIIKLGEQVIQKIQGIVGALGGFISGVQQTLSGFGNLLGGVFSNVVQFKFSNIGTDISNSMNQITSGFESIEKSFDDALNLLKEPLDFTKPDIPQGGVLPRDGEIPPDQTNPPNNEPSPSSGSPGRGGQLQPIHKQALDIISGPESGGDYNAMNNGKAGDRPGGSKKWIGKNLTDMTIGEVKNYQNNKQTLWAAGRYQIVPGSLPSAQSAARLKDSDMFDNNNQDLLAIGLLKTQGPGAWTKYSKYSKKEIDIMYKAKDTPLGSAVQTTPSRTTSAPPPPPTGINPNKQIAVNSKVGATVKTDYFGSMGVGRTVPHGGIDLGCNVGTYISCKYPCRVVEASSQSGYGYYTDIIIPSLNIRLRFAHLSKQLIKSGDVPAGKPFAQSGNSGRSTGPHIHMEATRNMNGTSYGGDFNPDPYVDAMIFSTNPPAGFVAPPVPTNTPAKITAPSTGSTQQMQAMTPERSGPTVVVAQPQAPQMQAPMGGGGGGQSMPNVSSGEIELNRLMTQRLLLELAYT